ncbi:hypothetical protein LO772_24595 [Yinghuangia sp. ASG 101]|uniref:hypothetical protein n=1 Tax=Yinghuangia sp. ASG 101 TaxID=2896848 RepID=UPI001E3F9EAA|nr:hypothetical protein [Yinghuangia sp. ASG 101]UGQ10049.1 hypothetical protein LO772_24595 [Yinghuangia sp. ASG 101]
MGRVYQAVLQGSGEHLGRALRRSVASVWGLADDGSLRCEADGGGARAVLHDGPSCGRYTVTDAADDTRLTAIWGPASSGSTAWAVIAVDTPAADGREGARGDPGRAVEVISGLLDAERAFDGAIPLETTPVDVDGEQVDELVAYLLDPRRRVPVIVLSVDEREPSLPARHAADLARRTAGTALVARLCDKSSQNRLNDVLGDGFAVYGGALRTYMAPLDPRAEDYPHRHPVRSGAALRESGARALDVVVTGVTGDAVRRPLPPDVRRGLRVVPLVLDRGLDWCDVNARPTSIRPRPVPTPVPPPTPGPIPLPTALVPGAVGLRPKPAGPPGTSAADAPVGAEAGGERPDAADAPTAPAANGVPVAAPPTAPVGAAEPRDVPAVPQAPAPPLAVPPAAWADEVARLVVGRLTDVVEAQRSFARLVGELRRIADRFERFGTTPEREAETEALTAELDRLRYDYDLLVLQYEELAEEARRVEDRNRRLDGLLAQSCGGEGGETAYDDVWAPDCLADVLLRARVELSHVSLPDSLDSGAATLDKAETGHVRVWAGAAWDALRALNAYASARSAHTFRGGFHDWCRNPPHGAYALSPKKFAMKESDAVAGRAKFRKARTFPVPSEVASEQSVFMEAHIKLRGIGNPAPRMHFHDDAAGNTGRIHIGYLGHHLDNTRTN